MDGREYLRILETRWVSVVAGFVTCVVVAVIVAALMPRSYTARTQIFVSTQVDAGNVNQQLYQGASFTADRVKSYTDLATSPRVTAAAVGDAKSDLTPEQLAGRVAADSPAGTVLINIEVSDHSAQRAADLTNAVGNRLAQVIQQLETPPGSPSSPVRAAIVTPAAVPTAPVVPNWSLTLALGVFGGLIVGIAVAIVREAQDNSIKNELDLSKAAGVVNIGKIVFDEAAQDSPVNRRDARSESFRQLRTNLQFSSVDSRMNSVLVTSAVPAEGKSSVTGNLAVALAELGMRVTVIDADLRRPALAEYFGVANEIGLTTVLIGRTTVEHSLQKVGPNLSILTSGPVPPNPSELLASTRAAQVLDALGGQSDIVLIDSAPVLPVTDARVLASRVDGVLLVVRAESTTPRQVTEAVDSLRKVQAHILGTVLNRVSPRAVDESYYSRYGSKTPEKIEKVEPQTSGSSRARHSVTPYPRARSSSSA